MKTIFTVFSILILVFVFSDSAKACSCMGSPTVDLEYKTSPIVAVLKIKSLEKGGFGNEENLYLSKMTVEKVFKGNLKVGQEFNFKRTNSSCDYTFSKNVIGEEMLLYLGDKPSKEGFWYYPACSRSDFTKNLSADLKYIENIDKVRGKTRLSGTISQNIESAVEGVNSQYNKLANRNVRIVGNGKDIQLKTDENGVYEIYDLPFGKYKVSIEPIVGYKTTGFDYPTEETTTVQIKSRQHVEQDFTYYIDNSISGKVTDSKGNVLKDVCLDLSPNNGKERKYFFNFDCTDEKGGFKLSAIPAGKYLIVINYHNVISASEPFGTFYYPSSINREDAKEITIGAGDHIKDLVITAPTTAETITISGVVMFENGVGKRKDSYEYVSVEFKPDKNEKETTKIDGESRAVVDEKGNFTLRILKGQKGKLYGEMLTFLGDRINCPKLDRILRKQGERSISVNTNSIISESNKNVSGVVLTFPFPSCKKSED
jgi:hypothetical protein